MIANYVGFYLNCDTKGCKSHQERFEGETREECNAEAYANGWRLNRGKQMCPSCVGKRVKSKQRSKHPN